MKKSESNERELSPEDLRLIATIDAAFRPEAMSPTRRVMFREALDARIAKRTRPWHWLAPLIASAAAISLWLAQPESAPQASLSGSDLYAFIEPDALHESGRYLPDDYQALATLYEGDEAGR
jgi:hypothetical protein